MKLQEVIAGVLAGTLLSACLDFSPVEFHRPDAAGDGGVDLDGGDDDGGADGAAMGTSPECQMCIETGSCSEPFAVCDADPKCAIFAKCLSDTGCWPAMVLDVANVPACLMDCGSRAFTSQIDPSIALSIPLLMCAQNQAQCGSYCAPE